MTAEEDTKPDRRQQAFFAFESNFVDLDERAKEYIASVIGTSEYDGCNTKACPAAAAGMEPGGHGPKKHDTREIAGAYDAIILRRLNFGIIQRPDDLEENLVSEEEAKEAWLDGIAVLVWKANRRSYDPDKWADHWVQPGVTVAQELDWVDGEATISDIAEGRPKQVVAKRHLEWHEAVYGDEYEYPQ